METHHDLPLPPAPTNATPDPYPRDDTLAHAEIATLASILLLSLFGNSLVLLALHAKHRARGRKTPPRMHFFIFHLCVADLINAFFNILPQLLWDITYRFKGGNVLCKAVKYGQILGPYLSSYTLVATALDRYRAICHPLTYHAWSSKRCRACVFYAWCVALILSIPQTLIFHYQEIAPGTWDCWATFAGPWGERAYVVWYSVSIFMVPLAGLVFTYTVICRVIWRSAPRELGKQQQVISRAKINTIKQTVAVIAAYIVCSLPFIVAELWAVWDPSAYEKVWSGPLFTILVLLSSLNSCANPWIFMIFNSDLFVALRMYLQGKIVPSGLCRKSSAADSSFMASEARKKSSSCLNIRRLCSSGRSSNQFNLKRWAVNTEEVGTPTTTEVTTLNFSKE